MIAVHEVSKRYGQVQALDKVSFEVPSGQVLGLLGQNGAGKTTLLSILSGYMSADSGEVLVNGHDMLMSPLEAKGETGYLPETPPLYPEMSVTEYLSFCCELKGVVRGQRREHIEELFVLCGLDSVRRRLCGQLSKGFRQRLGLAQALCGSPEVILLDEPSAGFDPAQAVEFRQTIASLAERHTIIFSSHILGEVQAMCDRVLIIHEGKLLFDRQTKDNGQDTGNQRYLLRIKHDSKQLMPALRGLPSVIRVKQHDDLPGITQASVESKPGDAFHQELLCLLSGLQAPLLLLKPVADSIEEVFLRITGAGQAERVPQ